MKRMYWIFTSVLFASLNSWSATETFHGFDLKNKAEKYKLVIGEENELLEERAYKLYRVTDKKQYPVSSGAVVYTHNDAKKDIAAYYSSDSASIQFGQPLTTVKNAKQVVVMKLKNEDKPGKTIVFEENQK